MLTISQIFLLIFILIGLSFIFSVVEWFRLGALSSKISDVEREVEMRSQEFDSIRKDQAHQPTSQNHIIFPHAPDTIDTHQQFETLNNIQIMKNVGGTFKDSRLIAFESQKTTTFNKSGMNVHQPQLNPLPETPHTQHQQYDGVNLSHNLDTRPTSLAEKYHQFNQSASVQIPPIQANERRPQSESVPSRQKITLYLYSDASKDADFNGLQQNINKYLSSGYPVEVVIDFSGIHFLYDQELDYLEKICTHIENLNGVITFSNCDQDVLSLVQGCPKLFSRISV